MTNCRHCGTAYEATVRQISKSDFECPTCKKIREREYRQARRAAGNPVPSGKMPLEYHRIYNAAYRERPGVRERKRDIAAKRALAPEEQPKIMARRAVRNAIRRGEIQKQHCEICGAHVVDAHHDDYTQPLVIRWLCRRHHTEIHTKAKGETP